MTKELEPETVVRWLAAILLLAICVLALVFYIYATHFSDVPAATDPRAAWGQFGDYIGGTANPILALLTLSGVLLTVLLQVKQLQNSKQELMDSKRLVSQSNESQARSASEMAKQAKASKQSSDLLAVSFLLAQYRVELTSLGSQTLVASDPRRARIDELESREARLVSFMDGVYDQVVRDSLTEE